MDAVADYLSDPTYFTRPRNNSREIQVAVETKERQFQESLLLLEEKIKMIENKISSIEFKLSK